MESILHLFELIMGGFGILLAAVVDQGYGLFSLDGSGLSFLVEGKQCSPESCPGSQFTQIAAAWANIGYVTHSDVLHYITTTKFGLWAPLLYVCAALAALVGVAINAPLRSYMWFFIGPAIYGFLIGTTTQVEGVNWVVANQNQNMDDVWRHAEVGLKNTDSVDRGVLNINGKNGPVEPYEVAMPMVFLDELFSATTNILIEWLGIYRHEGDGSAQSNIAALEGQAEGPWYLLSSLKWGMVENIVGVNARNPDFRDAFVTFLASECGDEFKRGIDSGKYISAGSLRGEKKVQSVIVGNDPNPPNFVGPPTPQYMVFQNLLDGSSIHTPRSLVNILQEENGTGQFGEFSQRYSDRTLLKKGRYHGVVCSEYLFTLVQQIRFEAGHWYWQLVRSSPGGLTRQQFLRTLFYGWDIRKAEGQPYASPEDMNAFVKHLIMTYLLRNELLFAPQITEVNQRFAPSEQSRSYSEAHVRTMGSKSKYQELYNWAVLMPHMQGILVYFLVIAYPFAAMVMVLPGYYKTFLTWISFFAWVKLWDVGFAIVMVLERSVWAMIGNNSNMARTANKLITTAETVGGIGVSCRDGAGSSTGTPKLGDLCPVPNVCSLAAGTVDAESCSPPGQDQKQVHAWELLDTLLTLGAGADLDLANGYYIYIMAALYFAVPAVTGQMVLGAKAGASSMLNSAIGGVAGEAGKAAMTGYQHQAVNQAMTNQGSLGNAAFAKAMRKSDGAGESLAGGIFNSINEPLKDELAGAAATLKKSGLGATAGIADLQSKSYDRAHGLNKPYLDAGLPVASKVARFIPGFGDQLSKVLNNAAAGGGTGTGGGGGPMHPARAFNEAILATGGNALAQDSYGKQVVSTAQGTLLEGDSTLAGLKRSGHSTFAGNQKSFGDYQGQMAVWEAKNQFASHVAGMAGVAGMNAGNLSAGQKPADVVGMGMAGELNSYGSRGGKARMTKDIAGGEYARYSNGGFISAAEKVNTDHQTSYGGLEGSYKEQTWYGIYGTASGFAQKDENLGIANRMKELAGNEGD
jgi:hypothetical protein